MIEGMNPRQAQELNNADGAMQTLEHGSHSPGYVHQENQVQAYSNSEGGNVGNSNQPPPKSIKEEVQDRLAENEEYQAAQADLVRYGDIQECFDLVDRNTGVGGPDNRIEYANLVYLRDTNPPGSPLYEAATKLMESGIWNRLAKDDQWVGSHDVAAVLGDMRNRVASIKTSVTQEVIQERAGNHNAVGGGQTTPTEPPAAPAAVDPAASVPRPIPSTLPGVDGALENLGNQADYIAKQMEAVANDPNMEQGLKAATMTKLQQQQQSAMNMMNQLMQMMSNTSKAWSEIAMNSVRNIK